MAGVISRRNALLTACARDVRPALAQAPAITGETAVGTNLELTGTGSTLGTRQERA